MKTNSKLLLLVFTVLVASFTYGQKKTIKTSESSIHWTGEKVTGKHTGTLNFSSGHLSFENKSLSGGEFVVDMTSLAVTDLEAGKGKEKLEGHLSSDDFFGIQNHATAKLVIKKVSKKEGNYKINGDLTIKGKTNPITFELTIDGSSASTIRISCQFKNVIFIF